MRFLGVFGARGIGARNLRHVAVAMQLGNDVPAFRDGLARHGDAVGAHIGDQADGFAADIDALVELLRKFHRARGRQSELARRLLLQGRRDEGRPGMALDRLLLDFADRKIFALDDRYGRSRVRFGAERELVELLSLQMGQSRGEIACGGAKIDLDAPVFLGLEGLDLELALADQPQRDRLNAAGRLRARQLAP